MGRRTVARILVALVLLSCVLITPAAAAPSPTFPPEPGAGVGIGANGRRTLSLRPRDAIDAISRMPGLSLAAENMRRAQALALEEYSYAQAVHDLNGDGLDEVVIFLTRYFFDPVAGDTTEIRMQVVNGLDGSRIWSRKWEVEGGGGAGVVEAQTGPKGENGLWIISARLDDTLPVYLQGFTILYDFQAVDAKGRDLWSHEARSQYLFTLTTFSIFGMLTADIFDGIGGPQSDFLAATGEYVETGFASVSEYQVSVVDGGQGDVTDHGLPIVSLDFPPSVRGVRDIDEDHKDDYVVMLAGPYIGTDEEDTPFVVTDGVVSSRSGDAGEILWDTPLDVGRYAWFESNEDITAGKTADLVIATFDYDIVALDPLGLLGQIQNVVTGIHLIEGRYGERMWDRPGDAAYVPGDIDGDGRNDVITLALILSTDTLGTLVRAFGSDGRRLYRKAHRYSFDLTDLFSFAYIWWMRAGDVHPDDRDDLFVRHEVETGPGLNHGEGLIIDAVDGERQVRTTIDVIPLAAPLQGRGSDLWQSCWRAPGSVTLNMLAGDDASLLWGRSLQFDIPATRRGHFVWTHAARTSPQGNDVVLDVQGIRFGWVGVLDGRTGEARWIRQMYGVDNKMRAVPLDDPSCE